MSQLTVRGIDDELKECIRRLAEREGISMSQAALRLLRKGADVGGAKTAIDWTDVKKWKPSQDEPQPRKKIGSSLDQFFGTWTKAEADEFDAIIEEAFETIDEEMWE